MMNRFSAAIAAGLIVASTGFLTLRAQDEVAGSAQEISVADPVCTFFGPDHDKFVESLREVGAASHVTEAVVSKLGTNQKVDVQSDAVAGLPSAPGGSRTDAIQNPATGNIDKYIFQKLAEQKVAPAPGTTDSEFVRRVALDLTGRIPTPTAVASFVNDTAPDKRAKLIDQLVNSPEWVDKWTLWIADLLENNSNNELGVNRFAAGVSAFNAYIRTSLQTGKPYNQMAKEIISANGTNSYLQGELNFNVAGVMGGGPIQDVFDMQTANIAEKFLGLAHVNCLLCHSGRGHLDSLSLWGYYKTRTDAWGMASFLSHTATMRIPVDPANTNIYYWAQQNNLAAGATVDGVRNGTNYTLDYSLNTQTGNRPQRGTAGTTARVKPSYIMNGASPAVGADYRAFLADQITSDFQFSRAIVNYVWEYYFGIGIVTPSNQFDPLRLDPSNPPKDCPLPNSPCTLQPSHPELLNALAQDFINSGYNLKTLMKQITNSRAYQLSSRYDGDWNSANERLFARKLVRRLWSEEVHDAVAISSGIPVSYTNVAWNPATVTWAMQLPEPIANASGLPTTFLNAFLRGNRDSEPRKGDATITQALALMNDPFINNRVNSTAVTSTLVIALKLPNDQAVTMLYQNILSRNPTATELAVGVANLQGASNATARTQEGRNLMWALYNKVDFIYNY
jgi:hypothetical protein